MPTPFTRRRFLHLGLAAATLPLVGKGRVLAAEMRSGVRLQSRPGKAKLRGSPGKHAFGFGAERDGYLSLPPTYAPGKPIPLILMLHGSHGGSAGLVKFCDNAAKQGIAVAVPESRGLTWDRIRGSFGPDIAFLDRVLGYTFDRVTVDPRRLAVAGFSDGASYALSVGLCNGDVFSHIIAYSPEFMSVPLQVGRPQVFIAHGVQDPVLSVNLTEQVVKRLKGAGYSVNFREFTGGHMMRPDVVKDSFNWFLTS
jgi:phospholipase/carboxylesterase